MKIAYFSYTGNVKRFVQNSGVLDEFFAYEITEINAHESLNDEFILITSTIGFGEVPETVQKFLKYNHHKMIAVVSSGNKNWGRNFGRAGERISELYNVPWLMRFELQGNSKTHLEFIEKVRNIYADITKETI